MRKTFILLALLQLSSACFAEDNTVQSFDAFRNSILKDYSSFRQSVLDDYADYLNSVWQEFKAFKGEKRDDVPKPTIPPEADSQPAVSPQENIPVVTQPQEQPKVEPQPVQPLDPTHVVPQMVSVPFYGVNIKSPIFKSVMIRNVKPESLASAWKQYDEQDNADKAKVLCDNAKLLGLNDWFAFEMVCNSVNYQLKNDSDVDRITLIHYLLTHMGFNVRLGVCGDVPCILYAVSQKVYAKAFLTINNCRYYVYFDTDMPLSENTPIYTCNLPDEADLGKPFDMRIMSPINISNAKNHYCDLSYKDISLRVDVNVCVMEMLRHYPQADIPIYAMSVVNKSVRNSILNQLRPYVSGISKAEAANKLLKFVQHAFEYSTDDSQHGYEKPYFFEENFYYPRNDCEDRAVFFAYLVRNLLDLEVHLIHYPGHECTAIHFPEDNVRGTGYNYKGKTFVICDPTYIGASIGQCMPDYVNVQPKVELWY